MSLFLLNRVIVGDCRETMTTIPDGTFQMCCTSPPYWGLRDYGVDGQLGLEATPEEYIANMVEVFRGVRRVLRDDGTLWLNIGDSYSTFAGNVGAAPGGGAQGARWRGDRDPKHAGKHTAIGPMTQANRMPIDGLKPKDMVGIPWMLAFALRADGWWLRADIIWSKPNPMPESVADRPTKAHEYVFLLAKSQHYFYDAGAVAEPLRYPKDSTSEDAARAGQRHRRPRPRTPPGLGSGTVGQVAEALGRKWLGIEINPQYAELVGERTAQCGLSWEERS